MDLLTRSAALLERAARTPEVQNARRLGFDDVSPVLVFLIAFAVVFVLFLIGFGYWVWSSKDRSSDPMSHSRMPSTESETQETKEEREARLAKLGKPEWPTLSNGLKETLDKFVSLKMPAEEKAPAAPSAAPVV
mmetsp:Transcript_22502/g.49699  ORF Transcript_22502/g.49699 Transcript_22502/m.49699 type:complete len:134 (-) Transcript_22502:359-760(-)